MKLWFKKIYPKIEKYAVNSKLIRPILDEIGVTTKVKLPSVVPVVKKKRPLKVKMDGLRGFAAHGDNWLEQEELKGVAVLWKFNPWKREFSSKYLPEFRSAFARGNNISFFRRRQLKKHDPLSFVVWGKSETEDVRSYAAKKHIPIYRMEDGFIRSAALGSKHTLPLSLVLDKKGIYYDATQPSDLEETLETYDFSNEPQLIENAEALLEIVRSLRVSKYNLGSLHSPNEILGPNLNRRVLVMGQVEDDASIRFGNAEGWSNLNLIELAREENPEADIFYKPHPDVLKGYRKGKLKELNNLCTILDQNFVLGDLFLEVDHVYVMTSLSGFEALMHGLKVTVVGTPFYAGWGLTDDRALAMRRTRKLSLVELFCGAYLLYPRYLTDLDDTVRGSLAAILRVTADREHTTINQFSTKFVSKNVKLIARSEYWPVLLRKEYSSYLLSRYKKKIFNSLSIPDIFSKHHGIHYQRSMSYILVGKFLRTPARERMFVLLRDNSHIEVFKELIKDLCSLAPSGTVLAHWAWILEKEKSNSEAEQLLYHVAKGDGKTRVEGPELKFIPSAEYEAMLSVAQFELRHRNIDQACKTFNLLLISGYIHGDVFAGLAEIARLKFDFGSAAHLLSFFNKYNPTWKAGRYHIMESLAQALVGNAERSISAAAIASKFDTKYVQSIPAIARVLNEGFGSLPYADAMMNAYEVDGTGTVLSRAKALISVERAEQAEDLLRTYKPVRTEYVNYTLALSQAMSYQGKLEDAKNLIVTLLKRHPTILAYREGLRVAVRKDDYDWGKQLLAGAADRGYDVGDIYHRKINLGVRDIKGSYLSFRDIRTYKTLKAYMGQRYVQSLHELSQGETAKNVVVAFFGPGDEIRFASLYGKMQALCPNSKLTFTCDPRLQKLLERHYADIDFVPVKRIRGLAGLEDFSDYIDLPGADLHIYFDNAGWKLASEADNIIVSTDALGDVIEDYSSFSGDKFLKADPKQVEVWKNRLPSNSGKRLVGLSWRSSITSTARNEHYLNIEELKPLFEQDDIQFVNLQYDDCDEELAWVETNYPGKMLNFSDLDQFNDLDGVSALMCALDLIITPATTVVEMAGALGCPTLLLSNSSELHWRKRPNTMTDVWYSSVEHVEGPILGDKKSLISAAAGIMAGRKPTQNENIKKMAEV